MITLTRCDEIWFIRIKVIFFNEINIQFQINTNYTTFLNHF